MSEPNLTKPSTSPQPPNTFHSFLKLPLELQEDIWQLVSPLTKRRVIRLRVSETTLGCPDGESKLLFSTEAKPSPFMSLCRSSRWVVLKELPTLIEQEGFDRIIRYNALRDTVMLYQLYGTHRCALEFSSRFLDVVKFPSKYPEVMMVFADIRYLAIHWRWAPDDAPRNIRALFPTRFENLKAQSLLYHPYIKTHDDHYFWKPTVGSGMPIPPIPADYVRPACQDESRNNQFMKMGYTWMNFFCVLSSLRYLIANGWSRFGYTHLDYVPGSLKMESPTSQPSVQVTGRQREGTIKETRDSNGNPPDERFYEEACFSDTLHSDDDEDDY